MKRLAEMETFVRVLETGSFSAAARQLRIGQPVVSKTIARLERRLGVQLLMRCTQKLTPTKAGQNWKNRMSLDQVFEALSSTVRRKILAYLS